MERIKAKNSFTKYLLCYYGLTGLNRYVFKLFCTSSPCRLQCHCCIYLIRSSHNYSKLINYLKRIFSSETTDWDKLVEPYINENAKKTIEIYEAHIKQVKAIGQIYGFKTFFFWPPYLLYETRHKMWDYERSIMDAESEVLVRSQRVVYKIAEARFSNREDEYVFFIANIFDDVDAPIYIDSSHVGPNGNEITADIMYEKILPNL